jgi:hypothetical protein
MQPYLALITPLSDPGNHPAHPIAPGGQPGYPAHPIAPGGQPPGIWGGAPPWVDNTLPGGQPHPSHPIAPGGRPPGIWGGGNEPFPTPPIVIPPSQPGQPPLVIWGPNDPRPTPPIHLPPSTGEPPSGGQPVQLMEWHTAWSEGIGWVVVGVPAGNHPAPSAKK